MIEVAQFAGHFRGLARPDPAGDHRAVHVLDVPVRAESKQEDREEYGEG